MRRPDLEVIRTAGGGVVFSLAVDSADILQEKLARFLCAGSLNDPREEDERIEELIRDAKRSGYVVKEVSYDA